jgi:hypothetical protein
MIFYITVEMLRKKKIILPNSGRAVAFGAEIGRQARKDHSSGAGPHHPGR